MTQLTRRRLLAIREALNFRLAGDIESDIPVEVYKAALEWTREKIAAKPDRTQLLHDKRQGV